MSIDNVTKPKLLFVLASLEGGGAERLTVDLANHTSKSNFNTTLFVGNYSGPYIEHLSKQVNVKRGLGKKFSKSLLCLSKLIRENNFDYIFCSQEYVVCISYFALLFSGRSNNCKLIGREASTPSINLERSIKGSLLKQMIRYVYSSIDILIAPTLHVKNDILQFYGIKREIVVLANPIDVIAVKNLSEDSAQIKPPLTPYIITVGRLIESKGIQTILEAMKDSEVSGFSLVVLGEGPYKSDLLSLTQKYGLQNRVFYLGFKNNPFPYIRNASMFVLASKYEGMPNALIQSYILGVPCCSSYSSSVVGELVDDRFIFDYGDTGHLASIFKLAFVNGYFPNNKIFNFKTLEQFVMSVFKC